MWSRGSCVGFVILDLPKDDTDVVTTERRLGIRENVYQIYSCLVIGADNRCPTRSGVPQVIDMKSFVFGGLDKMIEVTLCIFKSFLERPGSKFQVVGVNG